jgi:hypothetical protein
MLFPFIQPQVYCIPTNVEEFTDLSFFLPASIASITFRLKS